MSDKHCKRCIYHHNAGHPKDSRLANRYNDWCIEFSKKASDAVGHCKLFNGKKEIVSDE